MYLILLLINSWNKVYLETETQTSSSVLYFNETFITSTSTHKFVKKSPVFLDSEAQTYKVLYTEITVHRKSSEINMSIPFFWTGFNIFLSPFTKNIYFFISTWCMCRFSAYMFNCFKPAEGDFTSESKTLCWQWKTSCWQWSCVLRIFHVINVADFAGCKRCNFASV